MPMTRSMIATWLQGLPALQEPTEEMQQRTASPARVRFAIPDDEPERYPIVQQTRGPARFGVNTRSMINGRSMWPGRMRDYESDDNSDVETIGERGLFERSHAAETRRYYRQRELSRNLYRSITATDRLRFDSESGEEAEASVITTDKSVQIGIATPLTQRGRPSRRRWPSWRNMARRN